METSDLIITIVVFACCIATTVYAVLSAQFLFGAWAMITLLLFVITLKILVEKDELQEKIKKMESEKVC